MKWFKLVVAIILSSSLLLGAVQTEAASNTHHAKQVKHKKAHHAKKHHKKKKHKKAHHKKEHKKTHHKKKHHKKKKHKPSSKIHLKGKFVLDKGYSKKRLITLMRPEALKLVKVLGGTYKNGSVKRFNSYLDQHVTGLYKDDLKVQKKMYKDKYISDKKRYGKRVMNILKGDIKRVKTKDMKTYSVYSNKDYYFITYQYDVKYRSISVTFDFAKVSGKKGYRLVSTSVHPFVFAI
ncbi:hypothetical protein A374_07146 [Fictibacillus macauensis ZFHKF-1]|uniref:Uncharacterized protein n=1 Tax=Fictibacillus macauensis ZFHKF-1 TaxID=1196324 RepID=I8AJV6_9BACL|nr:hypothetical protein [Fictibacillus macauensis]EIT86077.1 hypothetical protein A374_07146 [Fictibacillus macauensis ZFHKF-1]